MIDLLNLKDRELANATNLVIDLQSIVERKEQEKQALNHEIHCMLQTRQLPQSNNPLVMELLPAATSVITNSELEPLVVTERLFAVNKQYISRMKAMGALVVGIFTLICAHRMGNHTIRRRLSSYASRDNN